MDGCPDQRQLNTPQTRPQLLDHLFLPSHLLIYFVSYIYVCSGGRDRFTKGSVLLWDFPSSDFLFFAFCLRKPPSSLSYSFPLMYSILFLLFFWPAPHLFATPHLTRFVRDFVWFSFYLLRTIFFFLPYLLSYRYLARSAPVSYYMHYSTRFARILRLVLVFSPIMTCLFYFFPLRLNSFSFSRILGWIGYHPLFFLIFGLGLPFFLLASATSPVWFRVAF